MSSVFVFLVRSSGDAISPELRQGIEAAVRREGLPPLAWRGSGHVAIGLGPDVVGLGTGPEGVETRRLRVIGNARLDNRDEVLRWLGSPDRLADATDMELVAAALDQRGADCIPRLLGDFGIGAWNARTRQWIAARDAFGIQPLFYRIDGDLIALSSRAAVLSPDGRYDLEYLGRFLVGGSPPVDRTVFEGVRSVPPGSIASGREGRAETETYWSPENFAIDDTIQAEDAVPELRELIVRAVRANVSDGRVTWSQLSGGLDSSTLVSVAQWLADADEPACGLGGTVSLVDQLGTADERAYSDAILRRWPLRNEIVADYGLWQEDEVGPPRTDEPSQAYPFYARDRRMAEIVWSAGGRVLLNGTGPDHFLSGSPLHFADLLARGEVGEAARKVVHWATVTRGSFWKAGYRYAIRPLLPPLLQRATAPATERVPVWIDDRFARRFALARHAPAAQVFRSSRGSRYADDVVKRLRRLGQSFDRGVVADRLDLRYPFLFRPLVELSLRLSPELRTRPRERKWVLREALRGVLPEEVRTRPGKGGIDGRIQWSLVRQRPRLEALLREPVLGDLGCIRPEKLRSWLADAADSDPAARAFALAALSLETWLCVRSGRTLSLPGARMCSPSRTERFKEKHHEQHDEQNPEAVRHPGAGFAG